MQQRNRIFTSILLIFIGGVERAFFYGILGALFHIIRSGESEELYSDIAPVFIVTATFFLVPGAWITQKFLGVRLALMSGMILQLGALLIFFLGLPLYLTACACIATGTALVRPAILAGLWSAGSRNNFNDYGRFSIWFIVVHIGAFLSFYLMLGEPGGFGYIILLALFILAITGMIVAWATGIWQEHPADSGITSWSAASAPGVRFAGLPMVLLLPLLFPIFFLIQKTGGQSVLHLVAVAGCILMIAISLLVAGVMKGGSLRSVAIVLTAGLIFGIQTIVASNFDNPYFQIAKFEESLESILTMIQGIWSGIGALPGALVGLLVMWRAGKNAPELLALVSFLLFTMVYILNMIAFRPFLTEDNLIAFYSAASAMMGFAEAMMVASIWMMICRNVSRHMIMVNFAAALVFATLFRSLRRLFLDYDVPVISEGMKLLLGLAVVTLLILFVTVWKKNETSQEGEMNMRDPFFKGPGED